MNNEVKLSREDKKLIMELYKSSFMLEGCYNYERQQALATPSPSGRRLRPFIIPKKSRQRRL